MTALPRDGVLTGGVPPRESAYADNIDSRQSPHIAAHRYWRAVCALVTSHLYGLSWPPPGRPQRQRIVGHWGCNPGIAWITGHLCAQWAESSAFQLIVGTGHAASFMFAHRMLAEQADAVTISAAIARYGAPGGEPSELLGIDGLPYSGGELGPALAVSQGMARYSSTGRTVACVVGDGECETPAALAALAHADVLLPAGGRGRWLPVINANGARMGGASRFDEHALARMLRGFGYQVLISGADPVEASEAAKAALAACGTGQRCAWISVTDKGWPAPEQVAGYPYRGHLAHKVPSAGRDGALPPEDLDTWLTAVMPTGLFDDDGAGVPDVAALARRAELGAPAPGELPTRSMANAGHAERLTPPRASVLSWRKPVSAVDDTLARRGIVVHSPDEARSNGLRRCADEGLVTEVLAEEICAAWTWGSVESHQPAAFVTYEAFGPLAGSLIAQYRKLTLARPARRTPPLLVIATSLGWANAPTHQNTDLTGVFLARPSQGMQVQYPVGAASAAIRLHRLSDTLTDGAALLVCSKQELLDLPDPGSPAILYQLTGSGPPVAYLAAVGDVCVTEAVAAAMLAARDGMAIGIIAVADLTAGAQALATLREQVRGRVVAGAACCAPAYAQPVLWDGFNRVIPVSGYRERWAATAWETLRANGLDRVSMLSALAAEGVPVSGSIIERALEDTTKWLETARDLAGVPPYEPPPLTCRPLTIPGSKIG
jgi:xylulose-5-phosphate/fructose-6-phosphate phosphoketolase